MGLGFSALLVLAGYIGASGQARLTDQYPWITVAAIGVGVSGVVHARWLLAGLVSVRTLQREVLQRLTPAQRGSADTVPFVAERVDDSADDVWVAVVGASRYVHRPGCPMVLDKPTVPAAGEREATPCGLCTD